MARGKHSGEMLRGGEADLKSTQSIVMSLLGLLTCYEYSCSGLGDHGSFWALIGPFVKTAMSTCYL